MEQLFNDMRQHLTTRLGSRLAQITEDCGQLDTAANGTAGQYPLSFPCVLISMPEVEWSALKTDEQRGRATLTVKVAFQCGAEAAGKAQATATQSDMTAESSETDPVQTPRTGEEQGKPMAESSEADPAQTPRTEEEQGKPMAESGETAGAETAITERLKLAADVNTSLHGWTFAGCGRPLRRTHSHQYSRPGEIKVYEVTYATVVQE